MQTVKRMECNGQLTAHLGNGTVSACLEYFTYFAY